MQNYKAYMTVWPTDGFEYVQCCPVCGSDLRSLLCDDLRDYFFESAPGCWALHRCGDCGCAYLNPRPSQATIGIAYSRYYTHRDEAGDAATASRRLWHRLRDDYLMKEYGFAANHPLWPGRWLVRLMPSRKRYLDNVLARNLPKAHGPDRLLLDVGCGNGGFLLFAMNAGWNVRGIDFDPVAVKVAQGRGLNVTEGSIESLMSEGDRYDLITLSHVLEHVSDPVKMLKDCYRLLKPGGTLWLDTPSIGSQGFAVFKSFWRGLEPPRHFVLFNRQCLVNVLKDVGFVKMRDGFASFVTETLWRESKEIAKKAGEPKRFAYSTVFLIMAQFRAAISPNLREFITLTCKKPD